MDSIPAEYFNNEILDMKCMVTFILTKWRSRKTKNEYLCAMSKSTIIVTPIPKLSNLIIKVGYCT